MLLSSVKPACGQLSGVNYWLATTTPDKVIQGHATPPASTAYTDSKKAYGSSCQVLVTFAGLAQVPATATLVIDQAGTSSTVALTVSRNVTVNDYLAIPALTGGAIAVLSFFLSVLLVGMYDRKRGKPRSGLWGWLNRPILGSGAWTASDSWATNISTGLVVVSTVLAATGAANSLFRGVALDRFTIVNVVAGFFVAAAPVLFGILYSWLTTSRAGLVADATVKLPGLRTATISVPSGASITLAADTAVADRSAHWATVRGGGSYQVPPGATIRVAAGLQQIANLCRGAAEHAIALIHAEAAADLLAGTEQAVAQALRNAAQHPTDPIALVMYIIREAKARVAILAGTQTFGIGAGQSDDANVKAGMEAFGLAIEQALMRSAISAAKWSTDEIARAIDGAGVRTAAEQLFSAVAGASGNDVSATVIKANTAKIILAMQQKVLGICLADVYAAMAISGGADIGILPGCILEIDDGAGKLTIQGSDVVDQPPSPPAAPKPMQAEPGVQLVRLVPATSPGPSDAPLEPPTFISTSGGAKVTVTGVADIILPQDTQVSAPQGQSYKLPKDAPLMIPQGTNNLVANLKIILAVNFLTMFGIGAELGIASVLADFSDASGAGHFWMFAALIAVALLVIFYAATATRAVADPQPGSSLSSQSGASFTL